jgi:hypothetical protein
MCVTQRLRLALIAAALASAVSGCGGHGEPKGIDLHRLDWGNATLPGSVCGAKRPIDLHHNLARVAQDRWSRRYHTAAWPAWPRVTVETGWAPVVYGDLDGDGQDEAAVAVGCSNGGGTADSFLAYARVIFRAGRNSPRVIGVITPRTQPPNELPTLVTVTIRRGEIVAREAWYGPNDGTCCPSGRSRTIWVAKEGRLHPTTTVVEEQPVCAPPRGPGDRAAHSTDLRVQNMTCSVGRRVALACARFTYGHSGTCAAAGHRWRCTSTSQRGSESAQRCVAGRRSMSIVWLD